MRKVVLLLIIGALPAISAAQSRRSFSLEQVTTLMEKRGSPLFLLIPGNKPKDDRLARVRYIIGEGKRLLLDIVPADHVADRSLREFTTADPLIRERLPREFDADLIIIACGSAFGDDECDLYSPINKKPANGRKITSADKQTFDHYLQSIGTLLTR